MELMQTRRQLRANTPLLLNDPQVIWLVESGMLALFATKVRQGVPEGERRYLYSVNPGAALFGTQISSESDLDRDAATEQWGIIAVALEPAELTGLPLPHDRFLPLLEGWVQQLSQVEGLPQPRIQRSSPPTQYVTLSPNETYQPLPDQVIWVQIQQGVAQWMGYPELVLDRETGVFPMSSGMWLEASEQLELLIHNPFTVEDYSISLNGLAKLHTCFFHCIDRLEAEANQAALARFQARQALNQQVTQTTIRNLATVLEPQQERFLQAETPLLIAAGAVGKALGVAIQPPMKSENLQRVKEPLEAIARASRLRLRRVLLRDRWWEKDAGAILAYTRQDKHPVALLPKVGGGYELFDPIAAGLVSATPSNPNLKRIPIDANVAATLDPIAYIFYRPLPDQDIHASGLLKFALQGRRSDLIMILLTGIAATLLGMLVPQATAVLFDEAIPYGNVNLLVQMGLGLFAAALGGASFQLAQAIASLRIETISDASMQAAVWDRLLKLKTSFFRQYSTGDLSSRVSGITTIRRKLSGTVLQTIFASFFSLLNLGLMFYYSSSLAILAVVVALIILAFTSVTGALLIRKHRPLMEIEGTLFGVMVQLINGVAKLRIAGAEERAFAYWGQQYTRQLQLTLSTQKLEDTVAVFNTVTPTLTAVALFWLAGALISPAPMEMFSSTGLSAGEFLAFNVAFGTFIGSVTSLSNTFVDVLDIIPTWQRSQPILTAEPEVDLNKADPGRLTGSIRIDHVTFRYREDGALILDDVTIDIKPGEFIALVGPSGSGKSTVMRLLLGFETPFSGTISYDGQDLSGLDVSAVRRQLGVVLQNSRINAGSIFENIASGALITLDDAWVAAERSGLADDIRAMPMQMHTLISEGGSNLSGGQRQRLVIARALALQPRILLFDEATSALDNRTQAIVSESLDRLKATRIVIAHRLSTIRNADRIYVLEAGRVVQQGTFDQLAQQPGLFAQLIRRQLV